MNLLMFALNLPTDLQGWLTLVGFGLAAIAPPLAIILRALPDKRTTNLVKTGFTASTTRIEALEKRIASLEQSGQEKDADIRVLANAVLKTPNVNVKQAAASVIDKYTKQATEKVIEVGKPIVENAVTEVKKAIRKTVKSKLNIDLP